MATQVAVKGAKNLPPSSPFGELLRRSKFAAYDPNIRQTYTAPPSYIARGNWGLKRPIANKQRDSSIVLRNFEEHAHYIEWDKARVQVDLVKRVEELNITPTVTPSTPWAMRLSPTATEIDSEFVSERLLQEARQREADKVAERERVAFEEKQVEEELGNALPFPSTDYNLELLDSLPTRGRGGYGMSGHGTKSTQDRNDSFVQYNIAAMSPRKFNAYLDEVRRLRPEFLKYIRKELSKTQKMPKNISDDQLVAQLGRTAVTKCLHRFFLAEHTNRKLNGQRDADEAPLEEVANAPQPIFGRPHERAGLMYASPTVLETTFTTEPGPGFILQNLANNGHLHPGRDQYVTTFAGLTASLGRGDSGPNVLVPLIEPLSVEGISAELVSDGQGGEKLDPSASERRMRLTGLTITRPPVVVGADAPNRPMRDVELRSKITLDTEGQNVRSVPFTPGSFEYSNYLPKVSDRWRPSQSTADFRLGGANRHAPGMKHLLGIGRRESKWNEAGPLADLARRDTKKTEGSRSGTLSLLKQLIRKPESE